MKSEINQIMQSKNLDAILVFGNAQHNPPMYYLTGGGHITNATLIMKQNEQPVLYCQDMERGEAEKTGLRIKSYSDYPYENLLKEANNNPVMASAIRLKRMLADNNILNGQVGVYGHGDISTMFAIFSTLQKIMPEVTLVGESRDDSLFMRAMETKDESEVERIRKMGRITTQVVGLVSEYLTTRKVDDKEVLLKEDGTPLTVGDVKAKINLWLAEHDAENPEGTIFAIGRDAGLPHSTGNPEDLIRLGQTIVFDIYPCESGGGYCYDFTRTWCLGYASKEAQELYNQVRAVYENLSENLDLNVAFKNYQTMACEQFEARGHKSPLNTQAPLDGYVHSIGHGLGLNVHERPWSSATAAEDNLLRPGVVITLEPGLYYPEKGMGVRIEDTIWVRPDGKIEILVEFPKDLVLPMKT